MKCRVCGFQAGALFVERSLSYKRNQDATPKPVIMNALMDSAKLNG